MKKKIAVAHGDGIGPEIMAAVLSILQASGAPLEMYPVEIGEKIYLQGEKSGIAPATWEVLENCDAFLKAPITTPQGGGFKSVNVTIRTAFGLYANIRPCVAYAPYIATKHPGMDVVIVRENEEDLYCGIEYQNSATSVTAKKIITQEGCDRIVRYAFNYATIHGRKQVTCFTKDNILKLSDGLFRRSFETISKEFPSIESNHWIVDIGAAKLADTPTAFDVIVMPNLYGDILSDVAAQIAGSVGLAGSSNIGERGAMFEAIHGSAPRRAQQNLANPSGLLMGAILMLAHLNLFQEASLIHNGWLKTIEDGIHTYDIFKEGVSRTKVGTKEFAEAVVARLGQNPTTLPTANYAFSHSPNIAQPMTQYDRSLLPSIGCDLFIQCDDTFDKLLLKLLSLSIQPTAVTHRGALIWPSKAQRNALFSHIRCRFSGKEIDPRRASILFQEALDRGLAVTEVQMLLADGEKPLFSSIPGIG